MQPGSALSAAVVATDLSCEYMTDPIGIDATPPRLSWKMQAATRGQQQTAYRLLVASSAQKLTADNGDLWDSGKVQSSDCVHVDYTGLPLTSTQQAFWKVMVWGKDGKPSAWSKPATFEMGLLNATDWKGKWIGMGGADAPEQRPAPFFRREFSLTKPIRRARAYICGLGYNELYLNGTKVGKNVLDPGFTRFDERVLYVTHDVTGQLKQGNNAVGVILGNGIYNQSSRDAWGFEKAAWRGNPRVILQLQIEFEDGTSQLVTTDGGWKVSTGPILFDATRNGEFYDARKELIGWDKSGYNDSTWLPAAEVPPPAGLFKAQMSPPIQVMQTLEPVAIREVDPGVFVVDFGQGFAGWAQVRAAGPAGTQITLRHSDEIDANGRIDLRHQKTLVFAGEFQTDKYTLKGQGEEVWEPRFTYHGTRYVEVTGFPGKPTAGNFRGRVVHTAFQPAGSFACSNELLNQIQRCTLWSYVSNFHSIPTDCPQREKNGWTGDAHLAAETGLYNFKSEAAYTKWMDDFKDEQRDAGDLPGIIPTAGWGYSWGNGPCWDSAYLLIPWYLYLYSGDTRILADHYDRMKRYIDYLTKKSDKGEVWMGLGDWVPPWGRAADYTAPITLSATGYYYVDTCILARAAELLNKPEDANQYNQLVETIKGAFNRRFYDPISGMYAGGSQTALSTALYQGLAEPSERSKVVEQLVTEVEQQKNRLNAGIHGTKFILHALTDNGRADVAWRLATQTLYPSWGYWMKQGATTLWESWDGESSHNHIMYGDISAWFYEALAGINPDPAHPGFKGIIIRPNPIGGLSWVKAEHESMYGMIRSAWTHENGRFALNISIPANTSATVYVPAADPTAVTEGGGPAGKAAGVKLLRAEAGCAVFSVESGEYSFASQL